VTSPVENPPGQPRLRRRADTQGSALARMRADLASPRHPLEVRSLAAHGSSEPAIALLDAWALVADVVAFYSERIATEGFLRTATQTSSVRELARTLGYELRPGVAAEADLVFTAETAPGAPAAVTVAAGTPVQSVPAAGQLPQTFQTTAGLEVRGVWNSLPAEDSARQTVTTGTQSVWLQGTQFRLRAGDRLLIVGALDSSPEVRQRHAVVVQAVVTAPDGQAGWTRVDLDEALVIPGPTIPFPDVPDPDFPGPDFPGPDIPGPDVPGPDLPGPAGPGITLPGTLVGIEVHAFAERARLFGWNAPDPNLLVIDGNPPPGTRDGVIADDTGRQAADYVWRGYEVGSPAEVDGDHPAVLPGSWLLLVEGPHTHVIHAGPVTTDGASKWTLSGPTTRVTPRAETSDDDSGLDSFSRPGAAVYLASSPLPAARMPDPGPFTGRRVTVAATDPPLPPGRRVLLSGTGFVTGGPLTESATVASCTVAARDGSMDVLLTVDSKNSFARHGLVVLANVTTATHGETVTQVLGSGGGAGTFTAYRPRRTPLTYLRATTPDGAAAELTVRVDGVAWTQVPSLDAAGPQDRVYALRQDEGGTVRIVTGDGVHGQRPASGSENVTATYRVGIGEPGAVAAGQLTLLPQRPAGVTAVTNPEPARDWAPPETLGEARQNAPLRVRTLDRAVSVADYEAFARGYAGTGPARADLVWDGQAQRVLLSVLGAAATAPGSGLVADLRATLDAARDPACPLDVLAGETILFGLRVELTHDPAYLRDAVLAAVTVALDAAFGAAARPFATAVTSSAVLVTIRAVPGVLACTMPRLVAVTDPGIPPLPPVLPPDRTSADVLTALPGRWEDGPRAAQLLALVPGGTQLREPGT
jgi:hypothetical protein